MNGGLPPVDPTLIARWQGEAAKWYALAMGMRGSRAHARVQEYAASAASYARLLAGVE